MKRPLEIATIKANSTPFHGSDIFWILSRNQLEFIVKEVEICSSPSSVATAKYQDVMLPVINLENYYGLAIDNRSVLPKYLVVRSINEKKELVKLFIEMPQKYAIQTIDTGYDCLQSPVLPQNSQDVLGVYSLSAGTIGVVPDFARISQSLQLQAG